MSMRDIIKRLEDDSRLKVVSVLKPKDRRNLLDILNARDQEFNENKEELETLRVFKDEIEEKFKKLESQLEDQKKLCGDLTKEKEGIQNLLAKSLSAFENEKTQLENQLECQKKLCDDLELKQFEFQEELIKRESEIESLSKEKSELQNELEKQKIETNEKYQKLLAKYSSDFERLSKEKSQLECQIDALEKQQIETNEEHQKLLDKYSNDFERVSIENQQLENQIETQKELQNDLEKQQIELDKKYWKLSTKYSDDFERLSKEKTQLKNQIEYQKKLFDELKLENSELQNELENQKSDSERVFIEKDWVETQLQIQKKQYGELVEEKIKIEAKLGQQEKDTERISTEKTQLQGQFEAQIKLCDELKLEKSELQSGFERVSNENQQLQNQLEDQKKLYDELKELKQTEVQDELESQKFKANQICQEFLAEYSNDFERVSTEKSQLQIQLENQKKLFGELKENYAKIQSDLSSQKIEADGKCRELKDQLQKEINQKLDLQNNFNKLSKLIAKFLLQHGQNKSKSNESSKTGEESSEINDESNETVDLSQNTEQKVTCQIGFLNTFAKHRLRRFMVQNYSSNENYSNGEFLLPTSKLSAFIRLLLISTRTSPFLHQLLNNSIVSETRENNYANLQLHSCTGFWHNKLLHIQHMNVKLSSQMLLVLKRIVDLENVSLKFYDDPVNKGLLSVNYSTISYKNENLTSINIKCLERTAELLTRFPYSSKLNKSFDFSNATSIFVPSHCAINEEFLKLWKEKKWPVKQLIFDKYFSDMTEFNSLKNISEDLIELFIPLKMDYADNVEINMYYCPKFKKNIKMLKQLFPNLRQVTVTFEDNLTVNSLQNFISSENGLQSKINLCLHDFTSQIHLSWCPVLRFFFNFSLQLNSSESFKIDAKHQEALKKIVGQRGTVKFPQLNKPLKSRFDWSQSNCFALIEIQTGQACAEFAFTI